MSRTLALSLVAALAIPVGAQSLPAWAEPPAPVSAPEALLTPPTGMPGGSAPVQSVPVDGGLGLLVLAGAGYAARRLRRSG